MESTSCPVCDANNFEILHVSDFTALNVDGNITFYVITVICKICGHVFSNPRMDSKENEWYYAGYFREDFSEETTPKALRNLYENDANWINIFLGGGEGRKLLEIGCYTGSFLSIMSENGWQVHGIEPNVQAARIAIEKLGCNIETSMFDTMEPPIERSQLFDLIVMGGVLEHITNPVSILKKANNFLKEGGMLFLRVPDVEKLILDSVGDIFTIEHPNMYSRDIIRVLFYRTGFIEKAMTSHEKWPRHLICLAQKKEMVNKPYKPKIVPKVYERVREHVKNYSNFQSEQRKIINDKIKHLWKPESKRIIIYGAGNHTEFLLKHTGLDSAEIICIADSNPNKIGMDFFGYPVISKEQINTLKPFAVVISSRAFQEDIYETLKPQLDEDINLVKLYDIDVSGMLG